MRENGVHSIAVYASTANTADVNVDRYPAHWPVNHLKGG